MNWQPIETAPTAGPQVLAAARYTKSVLYVWPSELTEKASNGEPRYKAWAPVIHPDGVTVPGEASAWWALVMCAAASIEDAANCLRDPDAKKQADGAAKHYREAAQKLMAARGVGVTDHQTFCDKPPTT